MVKMFKKLTISFLITTTFGLQPEILTPSGRILGSWQKSYNGRDFMAFQGVPYAKPPIGKHRFSDPSPIKPWMGVWNATNLYECIQINFLENDRIEGNEDCLYLNIYVPKTDLNKNKLLDVIVFIHGGGFNVGSGHHLVHPGYLMDRDVIFVTINYRLGVFGFLSTGDEVLPGNAGLRDQIMALKWIQDNINAFNGNPKSVTIIGMSAGGASVHFHYFSPLSKGLFHRGISNSGVALNVWALQQENPLERAKNLAKLVGCPILNNFELMKCLKNRPTMQLMNGCKELTENVEDRLQFVPVVDNFAKNPVLPDHPRKLLEQGKFNDFPWISSVTADEGVFIYHLYGEEILKNNWNSVAPKLFVIKNANTHILDKIRTFYTGINGTFNQSSITKLWSDRYFHCESKKAAKLQSNASNSSVYFYYFNYRSNISITQMLTKDDQYFGVSHVDDGLYMFPDIVPGIKLDANGLKIKEIMLDLLTSFAKTGKPTIRNINWKPTKGDQLTYLNIFGTEIKDIELKTNEDICSSSIWDEIDENPHLNAKDEL